MQYGLAKVASATRFAQQPPARLQMINKTAEIPICRAQVQIYSSKSGEVR